MKRFSASLIGIALLVPFLPSAPALSDSAPDTAARQIPARSIPVPATVSPELKKQAAVPIESLTTIESVNPSTAEEWQGIIDAANQSAAPTTKPVPKRSAN